MNKITLTIMTKSRSNYGGIRLKITSTSSLKDFVSSNWCATYSFNAVFAAPNSDRASKMKTSISKGIGEAYNSPTIRNRRLEISASGGKNEAGLPMRLLGGLPWKR
jgi:hypothetical protein